MSDLLIGTDRGVFRLDTDGTAQSEEGPASVAFFARAHDGLLALTRDGALWRTTGDGPWRLAKRWTLPPPPRESLNEGLYWDIHTVTSGIDGASPAVRLDGQARCR